MNVDTWKEPGDAVNGGFDDGFANTAGAGDGFGGFGEANGTVNGAAADGDAFTCRR